MDIVHITGIDVIDSYLHLNGFVRIEHKWSETNYFTMRVSEGWYVRYVTPVTLKWESCQVKQTAKWLCFSLNYLIYDLSECLIIIIVKKTKIISFTKISFVKSLDISKPSNFN